MHLRNCSGRTPLFLAANADLKEHVSLLRKSGAHLHADEHASAVLYAKQGHNKDTWRMAGVRLDDGEEGVDENNTVNRVRAI